MSENLLLDKKDVRILWNTNKDHKVTEMIVVEFTKEHNPQHLYQKYDKDIGNCLSDWDRNWDTHFIIFYFLILEEFENIEVKKDAIKELLKIKELRESLCDDSYDRLMRYIHGSEYDEEHKND